MEGPSNEFKGVLLIFVVALLHGSTGARSLRPSLRHAATAWTKMRIRFKVPSKGAHMRRSSDASRKQRIQAQENEIAADIGSTLVCRMHTGPSNMQTECLPEGQGAKLPTILSINHGIPLWPADGATTDGTTFVDTGDVGAEFW